MRGVGENERRVEERGREGESRGSWMGSEGLTNGKHDSAAPLETTSSLWFRSVGSPQLSAQHLAYVGQHSQPLFWNCNSLQFV